MNHNEEKDIELYKEFLDGNNESFNKLISKYRLDIIGFVFSYVKNIDIAEDLAQDTFVYVLTKRKKYDFKYTLKSYLYTIAKCRALNYIKKEKKIIKLDDSYMEDLEYEKSIEELYIKKEEKKYILNIINKLKPQYKEVILLREIDELRYDEISKVLKKSIPQIKILIHRARKNLEKIIREENIVC